MRRIILTIALCLLTVLVTTSFNVDKPRFSHIDSSQLRTIYLGTAGWKITDDKTVILVDPYLSRLRRSYDSTDSILTQDTKDTRKAFGPDDFMESDTAVIDQHIQKADYILVHHSHRTT